MLSYPFKKQDKSVTRQTSCIKMQSFSLEMKRCVVYYYLNFFFKFCCIFPKEIKIDRRRRKISKFINVFNTILRTFN